MKIIITDIHTRKAFDTYNILKKYFTKVHFILVANKNKSLFFPLIYQKLNLFCINKNQQSIVTFIENIQKEYPKEKLIYLPVEEDTTREILKNASRLKINYLLPSLEMFDLSRNKYLLNNFCQKNFLPAPKLFEEDEINHLKENFIPVICKPRIGSGSQGIIRIKNVEELRILEKVDIKKYVIQELIDNSKNVTGVFILMHNGKVVDAYCHKRIRTFPDKGGVSVYSAYYYNVELISLAKQILLKLNWEGFAMLEFLFDNNSKQHKLIEINPRLWGSVLLSDFSQNKMLINYINLCAGRVLIKSTVPSKTKYIRWFFPFDLLAYIKAKGKIKHFWKFNVNNICYINITYASFISSFLFHLYFYFNFKNFKKLINKWKK